MFAQCFGALTDHISLRAIGEQQVRRAHTLPLRPHLLKANAALARLQLNLTVEALHRGMESRKRWAADPELSTRSSMLLYSPLLHATLNLTSHHTHLP